MYHRSQEEKEEETKTFDGLLFKQDETVLCRYWCRRRIYCFKCRFAELLWFSPTKCVAGVPGSGLSLTQKNLLLQAVSSCNHQWALKREKKYLAYFKHFLGVVIHLSIDSTFLWARLIQEKKIKLGRLSFSFPFLLTAWLLSHC